jgi:ABC-type nickel/cobalt efflux system permease component RcnA
MTSIDNFIAAHASGHGAFVVLLLAFALGLRHASDPDHLVAVSTLAADTRERAGRVAARLGAAWGAGHATTLLAFGLPVLLFRGYLPRVVEQSAEAAIGAIIILLAVRLLVRWRRGAYHVHVHSHADSDRPHSHAHSHAVESQHEHAHVMRTPRQAFGIGLVHGTAGSAGIAVLLLAAIPSTELACVALVVLVAGCTLSMTLLSAGFGHLMSAARARRRLSRAVPALGTAALMFGAWYLVAALQAF